MHIYTYVDSTWDWYSIYYIVAMELQRRFEQNKYGINKTEMEIAMHASSYHSKTFEIETVIFSRALLNELKYS